MKPLRIFVALLSMVVGAVAANAQARFHGTFELTSETRWGLAVLPAGRYSLTLGSVQSPALPAGVIVIHSEDGRVSAMARDDFAGPAAPGGSYIFITESGKNRHVRSINLPQLGRSLVFKPLTRQERETLYVSLSQTIAVQLAGK